MALSISQCLNKLAGEEGFEPLDYIQAIKD